MKKTIMQRLFTLSALLLLLIGTQVSAENNTPPKNVDATPQSTMIVLDGSNSMWGQLQGINKIVTARESLKTLLENAHGSINFGLLTYGNKRKSSCNDFTLVSKPKDYDMVSLLKDIYRMKPRGRSPIADALRKAASTLPSENAHILLVSDGEESCGGDPCAVARELRAEIPSLQIDVIGFRAEKEAQLECIAENGNGAFVVADNTKRLKTLLAGVEAKAKARVRMISNDTNINKDGLPGSVVITTKSDGLKAPLRANYSIYTLDGNNVASFTSRTRVTEYLKPGIYRVKASWEGGQNAARTVTISPGEATPLQFDSGESAMLRVRAIDKDSQPVEVNYSVYRKNGDFVSSHVLRNELLAHVPIGNYRIKADFNGKVLEKDLDVKVDKENQHIFKFN